MKKNQLIIGIVLMVLGIGVSVGSVFLHFDQRLNARHRIANSQGIRGGYGFRAPNQRGFRNPNPNRPPKQAPNQSPNKNGNGGTNQ